MAVKVHFEIGHTSKLKSKKTPDGFTHDWELYVRGTDKNDVSHFVDKVVYNLHESFPKPKRVLKEAPYNLKESGYAGFMVATEIHFKNRDSPKVMTFTYDLSLQQSGPPSHRSEIKKFTFSNPSDEFRRKLLKGGGVSLVNTSDEKSRDSLDERAQLINKPKFSSDEAKKHKIRPEESKLQTFAKLFGPPITKAPSKVSPDAKNKASPSIPVASTGSKGNKGSEKSTSSTVKEKPEKTDKKDKLHKHSPHKEKYEGIAKDNKKISSEEKHERRDEKKKDKSHSKERDRSRDKAAKRPLSPKRLPSPKRPSPVRSLSAASRGEDTNGYKPALKSHPDPVGLNNNNNSEKLPSSSGSSSNKKSKKDKKSYDKDRDREKKEKERDRKEKDDRSSNNSTPVVTAPILNHAATAVNTKLPSSDAKTDYTKKEKDAGSSVSLKDIKEPKKSADLKLAEPPIVANDKKSTDKYDKDAEKRHKHKKKDKNKEKEKDKDYIGAKDKKKEKSAKKDDLKKTPQSTSSDLPTLTAQKSSTNPVSTSLHGISDDESHDSITESASASVSERPESFAESSNSSLPDVGAKATTTTTTIIVPPHPIVDDSKTSDKKERKSRDKVKVDKDEKKRKRKSKDDVDTISQTRKSTSPAINLIAEPPIKQSKKDELIMKNGDRSNSPHLSHLSSVNQSSDDSKAFRAPTSASVPVPSTSSNSSSSQASLNHHHQQQQQHHSMSQQASQHERFLTVEYMSELRDLQQKIMTLQNNNELQQVVEMIAATGNFEITSKTFDFDLCALDRNTVQKLQEFFATSCS